MDPDTAPAVQPVAIPVFSGEQYAPIPTPMALPIPPAPPAPVPTPIPVSPEQPFGSIPGMQSTPITMPPPPPPPLPTLPTTSVATLGSPRMGTLPPPPMNVEMQRSPSIRSVNSNPARDSYRMENGMGLVFPSVPSAIPTTVPAYAHTTLSQQDLEILDGIELDDL